jgi:hypothetical protein
MKLTDKLLTQLVNEELGRVDEKKIPVDIGRTPSSANIDSITSGSFGLDSYDKLPGKSKKDTAAALKSLTSRDGKASNLTSGDIKNAVAIAATEKIPIATLGRIKQHTGDPELKTSIEKELDKYTKGKKGSKAGTVRGIAITPFDIEKAKSFTFPRVTSSDATLTAGAFLGSQNELMKSIFTKGTIKERLEEMAAVSKKVLRVDKESLPKDARKSLQYSMFIDLCNHYINESAQTSGGYLFEALCAQICGGKVVGGSNGVADFVTDDGSKGSTKLYGDWKGIKQSVADEKWKVGQAIHYVIGIKKKGKVTEELKEGEKFVNVSLHYIVVTKTDQSNDIGTFTTTSADKTILSIQKAPIQRGKHVEIIKDANPADAFVGDLVLYSGENSFKEQLRTQMTGDKSGTKEAHDNMEKFFKSLFKAEENTKKYIATSDANVALNAGNEAQKEYDNAGAFLKKIIALLKMDTGEAAPAAPAQASQAQPDTAQATQVQTENLKLTEELLDKLIKAVIL